MDTTSSSGGATDQGSWKLTLPCTKAEAEAIADAEMEGVVLLVTEEDEANGRWRLDAYFETEPDEVTVATVRSLAPSAKEEPRLERLGDMDWVTMSQAGLEPIREGLFVVHTSAFPADPPPGGRAFLIEAGRAFGTGQHETTAGCLGALNGLADRRFGNVIDLGTGTGLLAFAARELWPEAKVMATDIDPVAIEVTRENMEVNSVDRIDLLVADGARDPTIRASAPFDLITANILAGPLIAMAPEIAATAAPGAAVVLAGLLTSQVDSVTDAYRAAGCALERADRRGDWTILLLRAGTTPAGSIIVRGDRDAWATDT